MDKKVMIVLAASIVILVGGILVYLGSSSSKSKTDSSTVPSQGASSSGVDTTVGTPVGITDMAFSPQTLNVKVGDKVTWTNQDSVQHTVTMDDGATGPSSQSLGKGDSYSYTFLKAGTYTYHCSLHPTMKATVVVADAKQRKAMDE